MRIFYRKIQEMLDYRAWIIAGIIALTAAGAYVIWITRPRAGYHARSLSAANHPADQPKQRQTRSLHVDGCNEDFIVNPGELVEPRAVPGASLDQFHAIYGKENKPNSPDSLTWNREAYSLTTNTSATSPYGDFIQVSLNGGHVLETLDGIEMGIDSFGTIFRKMQDKKVEVHERLIHGDNNWTLIVSMYSACSRRFRSQYSRTFLSSPEIDKFVNRRIKQPDGSLGPWRSDIFMNKVVYDYTMLPSNGHNDATDGSRSEHD